MLVHYALQVVTALLPSVVAQTCWRDTTCEPRTASFGGHWDLYIHSPASRTVSPVNILSPDHTILSSYPGTANLNSNGSLLIFDFGQECHRHWQSKLGVFRGEELDWGGIGWLNGSYLPGGDGALLTSVSSTTNGTYTVPDVSLRGGFRYLSVFATTTSTINLNITAVTLEISYQPTWPDLRAYGGYFYSSDDLINRIWYAGAYTVQTNAVPPNTGREYPLLTYGWKNDAFPGTNGSSIFVDGLKRDGATWSGDLGIALPSVFVSIGDFTSAKNALQLQYDSQQSTGESPMVGPLINFYGSDTYHMSTLIGTYEYILHRADTDFLTSNWSKIMLAINWIASKIDSTALLDITETSDWGRYTQGGHNTEANALMYKTLIAGSAMAMDW
ncbi:hypothetical protein D0Z07_3319 [Hyphodiscus hymeniophilus]|uniref:Alpha-L-rhamnosidase six-hairpin glycosidase domain-containing protein n=1 Tax=Hyphodiscus hymeniophilus TaxID=353542 RepID=A0A9P6VM13_9HELO|nr:hypothetical protein D0Z07_3319 [Hyphodiscus hymeniophilus]